jgi:hypothetical protein
MAPPRHSGAVRTAMSEAEAGVLDELNPPLTQMEAIEATPAAAFGAFSTPGDVVELYQTHLANLAQLLTPEERGALALELLEELRESERARQPFHDQMVRGIKALGFDRDKDKRSDPFPGASGVIHPAFAQAMVDMHARTAAQLSPASGPCRTVVLGKRSEEEIDRADRVARHINWQCTEQMREWQEEHDRLLMLVGAEGSSFKKLWYDPVLYRPRSQYIPSEYIVMPYSASDVMTSPIVGEKMLKTEQDVGEMMRSEFWLRHDIGAPCADVRTPISDALDQITGRFDPGNQIRRYATYRYWECQCTRALGSKIDGGRMGEYLITVAESAQTVVAIRRHWRRDDRLRERRSMLQHYKLFPWAGPYGLGLWHLIGGLGQSATGALRALLDSAHWQNMPGGFRLAGSRLSGGTIQRRPGDYPEIQVPSTGIKDIRSVIMPDPHTGPSQVLFELLGFLVETSEKFASIALQESAEGSANTPVGTTLARIDEGSRVYSEVFRRLHTAEGRELKEIFEIDKETIHQQMFYYTFTEPEITIEDFRGGISIVPVSDPKSYSQLQRAMQADARLQLVLQAVQAGVEGIDMRAAFDAAAKALQLNDAAELFPKPKNPISADPFTENMAAMQGVPLAAKENQPHEEHMLVHLAALSLPGMATTPVGKVLFENYMDHASMAALWMATAQMAQQQAGVPPGGMTQFPDPGTWYALKMKALEPALLPPPDPAAAKLAQVEDAKTEAARERTQLETQAKIAVEQEHSRLKLVELQAMHAAKMAEIQAGQHDHAVDSATKLTLGARANASKERTEAMWGAIEERNAARQAEVQQQQHALTSVQQERLHALQGAHELQMKQLEGDQKEKIAKLQAARAKARPKR